MDDEARDLLLQGFKIHPLAVEDAQKFNERPKVENYDDFTYLVVYGAGADLTTTEEVHFIFGEHFVITVHRGAVGPWCKRASRSAITGPPSSRPPRSPSSIW